MKRSELINYLSNDGRDTVVSSNFNSFQVTIPNVLKTSENDFWFAQGV